MSVSRNIMASTACLLVGTPAVAATVESTGSIGLLGPDPIVEVSTSDGTSVDPAGVLVDIEPDEAVAAATATTDGPGIVTATDATTVEGTITNTLAEAVSVLLAYDTFFEIVTTFDGPGESGSGSYQGAVLVGGEQVGGDAGGFQAAADDLFCPEFPCDDIGFDANGPIAAFDLAAGETTSLVFAAEVEAEAIAPIPLPAAIGPALLALAGLGWASRRRPG